MSVEKPVANYTGQGWEGRKYAETENLSTTDIAKRIRKDIKQQFPTRKCSVRTEYFSMGSSINVKIKDPGFNPINPAYNPNEFINEQNHKYTEEALKLRKAIERIGDQYRYDDTDGMIDYCNTNFYYNVSYPWSREYEWIRGEKK